MALFRLAWSNKIQLPLLITVCFMAFDIRLQLEINIFWEPPRPTAARQQRDRAQRIANANLEAIRAAAVNAALVQRQRQRQYLEQLARHEHEMRNYAMMRQVSGIEDDEDDNECAGFSTTEDDEEDEGEVSKSISNKKVNSSKKKVKERLMKLKQKKEKRKSKEGEENEDENGDEDDDSEDESSEDNSDDDDDDDDGDDDESGSGASQNPHPDYFGDSDREDDDDFYEGRDRSGDESDDSDSTGGIAPLVVELEIRQRSSSSESWFTQSTKAIIKNISILLPTMSYNTTNMFFRGNVHHQKSLTSCHVVPSCDKSLDAGLHLKLNSLLLRYIVNNSNNSKFQ